VVQAKDWHAAFFLYYGQDGVVIATEEFVRLIDEAMVLGHGHGHGHGIFIR
jgi:hypothetical protein